MKKKTKAAFVTIPKIFGLFFRKSFLITPLLFLWLTYFIIDLYIRLNLVPTFLANWSFWISQSNFIPYIYLIFAVVVIYYLYSIILTYSCAVGVYLIRDYSIYKKVRVADAFKNAAYRLFDIVVISINMAIVLIYYSFYQLYKILFGIKRRKFREIKEMSKKISLAKKSYRMLTFLAFPIMILERQNLPKAWKRAKEVLYHHYPDFSSSIKLMNVIYLMFFIPVIIVTGIDIAVSLKLAVYMAFLFAFVWSFGMYLEQLFSTLFFIWNMRYEYEKKRNPRIRKEDVPIPALLKPIRDYF